MRPDDYVSFAPEVVYRGLERPHLFHLRRDELYELDEEGLAFMAEADGTRRVREIEKQGILEFAAAEGLLRFTPTPSPRALRTGQSPLPSLRYLEVLLTRRCQLRCRHCYLGEPAVEDLDPGLLAGLFSEFDEMQGLRLLLSGGEPLLYPYWDELSSALAGRGFRVVLLTNGLALSSERLTGLPVQEVQISLDGLAPGHEALRGEGTFARTVQAAERVKEAGLDLSIATMIHPRNLGELEELEKLVRRLGAREWSLDVPVAVGAGSQREGWAAVVPEEAARALARGFGGSYHGAGEGFACGLHLAAVLPSGELCPCGFYAHAPLGHVAEGLARAWARKRPVPLDEIPVCRDCEVRLECAGGCRFRASLGGKGGPDPVMCAAYGRSAGEER